MLDADCMGLLQQLTAAGALNEQMKAKNMEMFLPQLPQIDHFTNMVAKAEEKNLESIINDDLINEVEQDAEP
jgi:hypothetical protein